MAAFLRVDKGGVLHLAIFEFLLPEVCRKHEGNQGWLHFFFFNFVILAKMIYFLQVLEEDKYCKVFVLGQRQGFNIYFILYIILFADAETAGVREKRASNCSSFISPVL